MIRAANKWARGDAVEFHGKTPLGRRRASALPSALTRAFLNRFAIGFMIGIAQLPWPGWLAGLTIGLLLSLLDAIITKAYAPIIGWGAIGGTLIGWIIERFAK